MSIERRIVIRCEGPHCNFRGTFKTESTAEAEHQAESKGWVIHRWDMYGNMSHFCSTSCKKQCMESLIIP